MPVNAIHAVENGDAKARLLAQRDEAIDGIGPGDEAVAFLRVRIAATQHGAEEQPLDVVLVLEIVELGLGHLPELFIERHARDERFHEGVEGGERERPALARGRYL